MSTLTTGQLLQILADSAVPQGYVSVDADKLVVGRSNQAQLIDYKAFYNPVTNELIITGSPNPQPAGGNGMGGEPLLEDGGIFYNESRVLVGPDAGRFSGGEPMAVTQTALLANRLVDRGFGDYPDATVTFVGEGAVGLALAMSSYSLRNDPNGATQVGDTVTLNSWTGIWTSDGQSDVGVLDVRTSTAATGDPGLIDHRFTPGGTTVSLTTGINELFVGGTAQAAIKLVLGILPSVFSSLTDKPILAPAGRALTQFSELLVDRFASQIAGGAAEVVVGLLGNTGTAIGSLGWRANTLPGETLQIVQGDISLGQWNVMHGRSPSGSSARHLGNLLAGVDVDESRRRQCPLFSWLSLSIN